ncbi:MAG: DNA polymerase III subunit gamma/tau [Eubacteriaceae bacterium]
MAYLALYRKYRPQTFDEVIGQDSITQILKNQIEHDRVGHAYLFSGIRGTGKTSLAKIFAKAINCPNSRDGNPCNVCEVCTSIENAGSMDIIEIDGASNRGVDEIREIREKVKYPPTIGEFKVYIIDEVHMLTKEAFNALLKTLEEPPSYVVFILATTEPNKCPSTILSRCQRFEIKPIPKALIMTQMKKICKDLDITIEDTALELVASRGENSFRDALSLLDQVIDLRDQNNHVSLSDLLDFTGMSNKEEIGKLINGMINNNPEDVIMSYREMINRGKDSVLLLDQVIAFLREILITKSAREMAKEILNCTLEDFEVYQRFAKVLSFDQIFGMIAHLIDEKAKLKYSTLQEIIVEMAFLRLGLIEEAEDENFSEEFHKKRKNDRGKQGNVLNGKENGSREDPTIADLKRNIQRENEERVIHLTPELTSKEVIEKKEASKDLIETITVNEKSDKIINSDKKYDVNKLFKKVISEVQKTNSGQAIFLKKASPELEQHHFRIAFSKENQNLCTFVNKPSTVELIEKILWDITKEKFDIELMVEKESFNDLEMVEKIKRIVNNDEIKIICE